MTAILNFKDVRRPWIRPPYPCYHQGLYLEEAMLQYYMGRRAEFHGRMLIPIFWTTAYLDGVNVQPYVDALDPNERYFAVSQHDDAIKEKLPPDTIVFSAGGNAGGIPIPLVCSPIARFSRNEQTTHDWLASFVGSDTHPIRKDIVKYFGNDPEFKIDVKQWSFEVSGNSYENFRGTTIHSKFTLCPRGYGAQSFRAYEAMQLGSVPVYIHDDNPWLPFNDVVPWHKFAVVIHERELPALKLMLKSISDEDYSRMHRLGTFMARNYFNIDSTCQQIHTYLNIHESNSIH